MYGCKNIHSIIKMTAGFSDFPAVAMFIAPRFLSRNQTLQAVSWRVFFFYTLYIIRGRTIHPVFEISTDQNEKIFTKNIFFQEKPCLF